MYLLKKGLNSFQLKMLALILMTFDHIAYFLGDILPIPNWFHLIGRISAPLFLFIVANGFRYTHNRISYMLRLYFWSVAMSIGNFIANRYFPLKNGSIVVNNIFAAMFLIVFLLYFIEKLRKEIKDKNWGRAGAALAAVLLPFIAGGILIGLMFSEKLMDRPVGMLIMNLTSTFLPTPFLVEGSIFWVILGIAFYYCLDHKVILGILYTALSGFFLASALPEGLTAVNLFVLNNQWFMILALPFILLYNKKKGPGMKYLFYVYYPAHVYFLVFLARALTR